jgi:hypothetical protein
MANQDKPRKLVFGRDIESFTNELINHLLISNGMTDASFDAPARTNLTHREILVNRLIEMQNALVLHWAHVYFAIEHLLARGEDEGITKDLLHGTATRYLESKTAQEKVKKNVAPPSCKICLEDQLATVKMTPVCRDPGCAFCVDCITDYLKHSMKDEWWHDIDCPHCEERLPDDTIKKYVTPEVFDK